MLGMYRLAPGVRPYHDAYSGYAQLFSPRKKKAARGCSRRLQYVALRRVGQV